MGSRPRSSALALLSLLALPAVLGAQAAGPRPPQPAQPAQPAQGGGREQELTLTDLSARLLPIAIPAMRGDASAAEVTEVLSRDLRLSALFSVRDLAQLHADLDAEDLNIVPAAWTAVGATSVVKARVTGSGSAVRAEVRVWEPGRPASPVLSQTFGPATARGVAHQLANELLRHYTGHAGVFGTRIVFARSTGQRQKHVFTVDCDGANLSQVSSGRRLNITPAWGPDGIYYASQTREGFFNLVRSGRPEPTAVVQTEGLLSGVTWGGNRLVFSSNRDGNMELYSAARDGTDLRRLTNNSAADVSPVFSPDGSRIAFVSDRNGSPRIFVMSADGSGQRQVTSGTYDQTPNWSPDGNTLVYASRSGSGMDIYTVHAAGGGQRRLTEGQGSNSDPTFSPDGRLIAFNSSRGGLWLMNQDGLNQQQILAGGGESLHWGR